MDANPAISACVMVKNMAATVGRTIASVRPHVDEVCVLDTGSTDETLDVLAGLARQPGAPIILERAEWPGHYAQARTLNTAMASNDWIITLDADEELRGGGHLRGVVARAEAQAAVLVLLARNYGDTRPLGISWISGDWLDIPERLFNRRRGCWHGIVHEHWAPDDPEAWAVGTLRLFGRRPKHHPLHIYHLTRSMVEERRTTTYIELMERAITNPAKYDTPRALLYAAQLRWEDPPAAIATAEAYLEGGWNEIEGRFNSPRLETLAMMHTLAPTLREKSRVMAAVREYARAYGAEGRGELNWWGLSCHHGMQKAA